MESFYKYCSFDQDELGENGIIDPDKPLNNHPVINLFKQELFQ